MTLVAIIIITQEIPHIYGYKLISQTIYQLPDSVKVRGLHVNFGVAYEQSSIFGIPIWNYNMPEYVLVSNNDKDVYKLTKENLTYLKKEYAINIDKMPVVAFWNRLGGKFILGGVLILVSVGGYFFLRNFISVLS